MVEFFVVVVFVALYSLTEVKSPIALLEDDVRQNENKYTD